MRKPDERKGKSLSGILASAAVARGIPLMTITVGGAIASGQE